MYHRTESLLFSTPQERMQQRAGATIHAMRPIAKAGIVAGGYVAAFAVAWLVVSIYVASTSGPDRQTYGAMYGFGDMLLFLAVFGLAAVPATRAALLFLRPRRGFWRALSIASLVIAASGVVALLVYVVPTLHSLAALAPLRIFAAPLFGAFFFLSGVLAPNRCSRISLLCATGVEAAVFAYIAV